MDVPGVLPALHDGPLRDREGLLVGRIEDLLFDAATNRPAWVVVRLADGRRTLAPCARARPSVHGGLCLAAEAETVRACPVTLAGPAPRREHVVGAARHYGLGRFARVDGFTSCAAVRDAVRAA